MVDPLENGLFDIPDNDNMDETFPPLPPPFSPGEGGDPFTGEGDGEISKLAEVPAAKRRGVKRPQPKLDSQRLTSERGLPALRTLFDNVHFKGKGHEAEELRVLMQRMENWAHRLYPKLQFEDFIDKLETLGSKKEVQTCLKRIRLDMPLIHEDFIGNDGEDDAVASSDGRVVNHDDPDPFGDGGLAENPPGLVPSTPAAAPSQFLSSQAGPVHSTPAPSQFLSSQAGPVQSTPAPSLTEEQQRRIELNKQLALERRLARVQQHTGGSQEMTSSQSADGPSTSQSQEMTSSQSADGPSTSQSQEMTSSQSADGPSTSQSQEMTSSQSADGPSTSSASSSHPFPSQQQQDGEDEDPDPEDQGQSRPDHPRDRALNTASPAEADSLSPDSLLCEGAVASQPCS